MDTKCEDAVRDRFRFLSPRLNERLQRLWAGAEAKVLGWGGIRTVARASGLAINTVRRGYAELTESADCDPQRIRRESGGRKAELKRKPRDWLLYPWAHWMGKEK